jgi:hypothetical protein
VPVAVKSLRLTPALVASIVTALVSWWLCYGIVASVTRSSARPAVSVQEPGPEVARAAGTAVTLGPALALHVRSTLIDRTATSAPVVPSRDRTPTRAPAIDPAASSNPAPAMSTPAAPPATPEPLPAAPAAPSQQSAPTPRPTITPAPKHAAAPDFDQSQPSGFDTSG